MNFGKALEELKTGHRVRRAGWNGPDQYIYLVAGSNFKVNREPLLSMFGEGHEMTYQPHIDMITQQGSAVPWLASQTDMLAEDWLIVELPGDEGGTP